MNTQSAPVGACAILGKRYQDIKIGYSIINSRAETLQENPALRSLIQRNRIIIPSDGFYEWKRLGNDNQPYRFQLNDKSLIWLCSSA